MISNLNSQQKAAVEKIRGPLLVLAGAGTGKTRVITFRIAHMIEKGISPDHILAVTFTNKAAKEMKERVSGLVSPQLSKKVMISTFHSLGLFILKKHISTLGFRSNFTIFDDKDCQNLLKKMLKEELPDWKPSIPIPELLSLLSRYRLSLYQKTANFGSLGGRLLPFIYKEFRKYLKNCNAVDFDDLIFLALEVLNQDAPLKYYQSKFHYLLVDEFQDANGPQFDMVKKIAGDLSNLCVVGDDDQAIYGFRGSDSTLILNFKKYFPNAFIVKLENNYRSNQLILKTANALIDYNQDRYQKKLKSTLRPRSEKIPLIKGDTEKDEAEMVIENLRQYRQSYGFGWKDMAILYRTNTQSRVFEQELLARRIPYQVIGGTKFFDRKEVKDILAYLKVIANDRDEAALYRVLNVPPRGIGQSTISKVNEYCRKSSIPFIKGLKAASSIDGISSKSVKSIDQFLSFIQLFRDRFKKNSTGFAQTIKSLIDQSNYEVEVRRHHHQETVVQEKMGNCQGLVSGAIEFEGKHPNGKLSEFLETIILDNEEPSNGKDSKEEKIKKEGVKLMTLHNSKGLEFPLVALVGLNEKVLPHERSMTEGKGIEEERRLLYVGITRAQKELLLSLSKSKIHYGKTINHAPSRFLKNLPQKYLDDNEAPVDDNEAAKLFESLKAKF